MDAFFLNFTAEYSIAKKLITFYTTQNIFLRNKKLL